MQQHVVVYLDHPSSADILMLQDALRVPRPELDPILPYVSPPMADAEALAAHARLPDLRPGEVALVQPLDHELPRLQQDDVLEIAVRHPDWTAMLDDFAVQRPVSVDAREHSRCWLVLIQASRHGIPPGMGFIIDKHSRVVLPRRYVDVQQKLGAFTQAP